ncbi:MAG: hypothetical protein ACHQ1G_05480 [Planctomycetota bacterium]
MRSRIRSLLLLLLLGALLIETITWIRAPLFDVVHRAYPDIGLDREGRVVYYDSHRERDALGGTTTVHVLDVTRNTAEILALGPSRAMSGLVVHARAPYRSHLDLVDYAMFLKAHRIDREPGLAPLRPLESLAKLSLTPVEARRRGIRPGVALVRTTPPIEWRVEDDRLVCRETETGRVVASLGPDGYAREEAAEGGERFGHIHAATVTRGTPAPELLLLEWDSRRLYAVSLPNEQGAEDLPIDSTEPVTLTIETRPLHTMQGGAQTAGMPYCAYVGRRMLVFLGDGSVVAEIELEAGEGVASTSGALLVRAEVPPDHFETPQPKLGSFGVETTLSPSHADTERRRLRLFSPGQPDVVRDVVLTPTRAGEVFLANLTAALALLRPPPLTAVSALSPLPANHLETWWWRDPWLANGSYTGWLILSLGLAAFCAWRAWRAARERCATLREVRFWTAAVFLLGPVGLLWMRFVLPRVPVEAVSGARRAVNLDSSPSTNAPWPEPKPLGIEVFS